MSYSKLNSKGTYDATRPKSTAHPSAADLGIVTDRPKHPQFATLVRRRETFAKWPTSSPMAVDQMILAGLVYTGVDDAVRCYYCDGGLRNWEERDNALEEHAKWYPNCTHVHLVRGKQHHRHSTWIGLDKLPNPNIFGRRRLESIEEDETSEDEEDAIRSLQTELDRLIELNTCKVCSESVADIVFLPCAHMVSCGQCAPALATCPLCRKGVQGLIKAYFAIDTPTNITNGSEEY